MNQLSAVILLAVCCTSSGFPQEKYDSKYDSFDVDTLLGNDRILKSYVRCMLDKGPCTPEGKDFKKTLPDALMTSCSKCTDRQKEIVRTVSNIIIKSYPDDWELLVSKYDKDGKYRQSFDDFLKGQ